MNNYDIKTEIVSRGYGYKSGINGVYGYVNEATRFCVILTPKYELGGNNSDVHECHAMLMREFEFAEKSTICVIEPGETSFQEREDIMRNEYHFVKTFPPMLPLPDKVDKGITINFKPMRHGDDRGDFTLNPFDKFDGKCSGTYLRWLALDAKDGDTVKYPPIINSSFFRYHAEKLFTVINHK